MVEHNSTTMEKRSLSNDAVDADGNDAKRARVEGGIRRIIGSGNGGGEDGHVTTLVEAKQQSHSSSSALVSVPRTSELKAPTMCLLGHGDAVHSVKFSHCGNHLASGSFDKQILLWNVFGDCDNYAAITGHKNAVQEVQWAADNMYILSASADQTLGWWDVETGSRVRKLSEHENIVNSCSVALNAEHTLGSASDDKTAKLWDPRQKACTYSFDHDYQVLTVALTRDGQLAYTAGVDHKIRAWDVRKPLDPVLTLPGHADIVTGCALSPDDAFLVSTGMDTKTYLWDVRPFVVGGDENRLLKEFQGSKHNFEKLLLRCAFSAQGDRVAAGSSDATACIWQVNSGELLYKLPGHKGAVREVVFHPSQNIIASCSSDKTVLLGEIA